MDRPSAEALAHPSVHRLKRVARALGVLVERVVFIGGAITPLMLVDSPFGEARPTKDVDAVVATTTYSDIERVADALRALGFHQRPGERAHMHRWFSPEGDILDLVPSGDHQGGSGLVWDQVALESPSSADLADGIVIRHANAAAFLGLKWAAHKDRGAGDPLASQDLEDVIALVVSRPTIVAEVRGSSAALRTFLIEETSRFLDEDSRHDLLSAHLNHAQDPAAAVRTALERMQQIRAIG